MEHQANVTRESKRIMSEYDQTKAGLLLNIHTESLY